MRYPRQLRSNVTSKEPLKMEQSYREPYIHFLDTRDSPAPRNVIISLGLIPCRYKSKLTWKRRGSRPVG